jgi:hypothetical protein
VSSIRNCVLKVLFAPDIGTGFNTAFIVRP